MIIDYDHNPNITTDQKVQSLQESVQMALNENDTEHRGFRASLDKSLDKVNTAISSIKESLTKILADINDRSVYYTGGNPINPSVYHGTGTISHNQLYFNVSKSGDILVVGRLNVNNFARTGANPGVEFSLPNVVPTPTRDLTYYCGFRAQSPRESAQLYLYANSRTARLLTTESYANAANGTLTFILCGMPLWK